MYCEGTRRIVDASNVDGSVSTVLSSVREIHLAAPVSAVSSSSSNGTHCRPRLDILIGILCAAARDRACLYGIKGALTCLSLL